jgi:transposase
VPEQDFLLPPSPRDWLPEGHLAFFVSDLVDTLDLSAITAPYEAEDRGYPPYHPAMMTKVLLYAYCTGVFSSRKIQRRLVEDVAFRVLAAGNAPDFRTVAAFRRRHLVALAGLFQQVLRVAREAGALSLGRVAVDGSKFRANASKHKAMSYGRLRQQEAQVAAEVEHLLTQAEASDREEDARHGADRRGDELPEELQRRQTRLARIRAAKAALEARAQDATPSDAPAAPATPPDTTQYNFTDPESRIMKGPDGFVQGYNAHIAVESVGQFIVGQSVTDATNDKRQLAPMLDTIEAQAGQLPQVVLADSGFCSDAALTTVAARGVEAYVATRKYRHRERLPPCPRGRLPRTATPVDRMARKLLTQVGRRLYALRKTIVEPVFGQVKHVQGFRQFSLRGLARVQGEFAFLCLSHNVRKLHRWAAA